MIQYGVTTTGQNTGLLRYEAACRALADAKQVDEVLNVRDEGERIRFYAKQAKNKQLEIDASEIRFRAERRLGEMMAAQRDAGLLGAGGDMGKNQHEAWVADKPKPPTLAEAGIDKNLADRARKYAAIPEQQFEGILADRRERIETENRRVTVNLLEAGVRGTLGTGENEWYTPDEYLDYARQVLGSIELDPASTPEANTRVQAENIFTLADNGLTQDWYGRVWLNPPYSQPAIAQFAEKTVSEWKSSRVQAAIVLTHNYTDTAWFQALAGNATAICFTRGRIRFVSPNGELAAPTQGQAFFYFGKHVNTFASVFSEVGFVVEVRP